MQRYMLILEDDVSRREGFSQVIDSLDVDLEVVYWYEAHAMIREAGQYLAEAVLVSLDHDLEPMAGSSADPGDGLDVARYLATQSPTCPVIVHTSNYDRAWSMINELTGSKWGTHRVAPIGGGWITEDWCPVVRELLGLPSSEDAE